MDSLIKYMDSFSKHWAAFPRKFPSPFPLISMGDITEKNIRMRRTFPTCNFSLILRGGGDFTRKSRTWRVQAPCVITQWPGESLDYGPIGPDDTWDELYLIYDAKSLSWFRQRGMVQEACPLWPIHNLDGVMAQVDELRTLSRCQSTEFAADQVDRICERLILETLLPGTQARSGAEDDVVQHIIMRLQHRPHLPHDFNAIAKHHGLSPSTLRRRWFEAVKITPGRYLQNLRLQNARRLLAETTLPVGEIAAQTGFQDMFYFSRRFKSETKRTPTQYRRHYRMGLR
jgi:AraC-like DNA-binding protein